MSKRRNPSFRQGRHIWSLKKIDRFTLVAFIRVLFSSLEPLCLELDRITETYLRNKAPSCPVYGWWMQWCSKKRSLALWLPSRRTLWCGFYVSDRLSFNWSLILAQLLHLPHPVPIFLQTPFQSTPIISHDTKATFSDPQDLQCMQYTQGNGLL